MTLLLQQPLSHCNEWATTQALSSTDMATPQLAALAGIYGAGRALAVVALLKLNDNFGNQFAPDRNPCTNGLECIASNCITRPLVQLSEMGAVSAVAPWDSESASFVEWTQTAYESRRAVEAFYETTDADS